MKKLQNLLDLKNAVIIFITSLKHFSVPLNLLSEHISANLLFADENKNNRKKLQFPRTSGEIVIFIFV